MFIQAISFALTATDNAKVRVIDRGNCVFKIDGDTSSFWQVYSEIFRLNNVHVDRIKIQSWEKKTTLGVDKTVTVDLHGDDTIYELTQQQRYNPDSELDRETIKQLPNAFKVGTHRLSKHTLRLKTDESERITRAWQYVYANGCTGKQSPF